SLTAAVQHPSFPPRGVRVMPGRHLLAALFAAVALAAPLSAGAQAPPARARGTIEDWGQDGGRAWVEFGQARRFLIDRAAVADPAALQALLEKASDTGRLLLVDYDGEAGDVIDEPLRITFHVEALTFDGQVLRAEPPAPADRRPSGARADL